MVPSEVVLSSFITDSLRLCAQARNCVTALEEQARFGKMSPGGVHEVYQVIHTLKGTATMVPGAEAIVEALHQVEGRLACRPVTESAEDATWLEDARAGLARSQQILEDLRRKVKYAAFAPQPEPLVKGMLVIAWLEGMETHVWFPVSCVGRVLRSEELSGQTVCLEGQWVSVIGRAPADQAPLGLAIRSSSGTGVLLIRRVSGLCAWSEAQKQGAKPGIELLATSAA